MAGKQGCLPSPTLFDLCIDKWEMVNRAEEKEGLDDPKVMQ